MPDDNLFSGTCVSGVRDDSLHLIRSPLPRVADDASLRPPHPLAGACNVISDLRNSIEFRYLSYPNKPSSNRATGMPNSACRRIFRGFKFPRNFSPFRDAGCIRTRDNLCQISRGIFARCGHTRIRDAQPSIREATEYVKLFVKRDANRQLD